MTIDKIENMLKEVEEAQKEIFEDVKLTNKYNQLGLGVGIFTNDEIFLKELCYTNKLSIDLIRKDLSLINDCAITEDKKKKILDRIDSLSYNLTKIKKLNEKINWF